MITKNSKKDSTAFPNVELTCLPIPDMKLDTIYLTRFFEHKGILIMVGRFKTNGDKEFQLATAFEKPPTQKEKDDVRSMIIKALEEKLFYIKQGKEVPKITAYPKLPIISLKEEFVLK